MITILFGFIFPFVVLAVEGYLRWCTNAFFDPIPSWWHIAMVASVGLGNGWLYLKLRDAEYKSRPRDGLIIGIVMGISVVYMLRFLPLVPLGLMLLLVMGIGILVFSPLITLIVSANLALDIWHRDPADKSAGGLGKVRGCITLGMILGVLCVFGAELPHSITRNAALKAISGDPKMARQGINTLKNFGSQGELLKLCYCDKPQMSDVGNLSIFNYQQIDPGKARNVFYRVTGIPFNREQYPHEYLPNELNWWRWDSDLGQDAVGARSEYLYLKTSNLNVACDANSASADIDWTFIFENKNTTDAEARTNILLPPGAVVSDLTLWINGKPQPAAFGSKSQVRSAYQAVVQRQRDPVLVTSAGGDRVLLQCFPVPRNGEMKTRIRIASPLLVEDGRASIVLPRLVENNFEIAGPMTTDVRSVTPLRSKPASLSLESIPDSAGYSARGTIDLNKLGSDVEPIVLERQSNVPPVTKRFSTGAKSQILTQMIEKVHEEPVKNVVLVIDASLSMRPHAKAVSEAVGTISAQVPWSVVVAADEVSALTPEDKLYQELTPKVVADKLTSLRFQGGPDNAVALRAAIELASRTPGSRVLWIHGPQPVLFEDPSKFFTSSGVRPIVYSFEVESGPNLLTEKLSDFVTFKNIPRFGTVKADLIKTIGRFNHGADLYLPVRKVTDSKPSIGATNDTTHSELIKLWAADQVFAALKNNDRDNATRTATTYRIVTPVSGAVVLETRQQFQSFGLKQGEDPTAKQSGKNGEPVFQESADVPSVPEPEMWLMMFVVGFLLATQNRRVQQLLPVKMRTSILDLSQNVRWFSPVRRGQDDKKA
jgi:hypothetical protein